ncbi:MAG: hypothetical protein LIO75_01765 [Lachnospiraceae bacterium]|nr:hypothetical protein [Lachnospiraceae bacterium]
MKNKSLSTLGFIMDSMDIQTIALAQNLHVDASLVSKWKTGSRTLSERSAYFNDVIEYLISFSEEDGFRLLTDCLHALYPQAETADLTQIRTILRRALASQKPLTPPKKERTFFTGMNSVPALVFDGCAGRRTAILKLLDYADEMSEPGDLIFLDSEEYNWLLENRDFSGEFSNRIMALLKKGFHAKFVIHYSTYRERFIHLFNACSPLLFHRNVKWYYYEYYDENLINFSFFILNHAISLLGISVGDKDSSSIVFTDNNMVIRHEAIADYVIAQCRCLFEDFDPSEFETVVNDIYPFKRKGSFYCMLPAPAFMSVKEYLLKEILSDNGISDADSRIYLDLYNKFRKVTSCHYFKKDMPEEPFIYIFQLEEMVRRIRDKTFVSGSLTLLNGKTVKVTKRQYAQEIRDLAKDLMKYENMQIVFVSEKDLASLPYISCWCRQNLWMVQMDKEGFRLSDEVSVVNAAAAALEQCIRRTPPERKNKESVRKLLLNLAEELEAEE